jgi:hypothetical protein
LEALICQGEINRGEIEGLETDQTIELAAAKRRIRQLETELAVSRKVNEVFLYSCLSDEHTQAFTSYSCDERARPSGPRQSRIGRAAEGGGVGPMCPRDAEADERSSRQEKPRRSWIASAGWSGSSPVRVCQRVELA